MEKYNLDNFLDDSLINNPDRKIGDYSDIFGEDKKEKKNVNKELDNTDAVDNKDEIDGKVQDILNDVSNEVESFDDTEAVTEINTSKKSSVENKKPYVKKETKKPVNNSNNDKFNDFFEDNFDDGINSDTKIDEDKKEAGKFDFLKSNKAKIIILVACVVVLLAIAGIITASVNSNKNSASSATQDVTVATESADVILSNAKTAAMQYDYDKAIDSVKKIDGYENNNEISTLISQWESEKANLVEFPCEDITHVFVHSLVYDTSLAFDGDFKQDGYNLVMTTVSEFNKMMQSMYDKGYVLVSMHDICTFDESGNRVDHQIMLPKDKKAFVLSQDDLCYYHSQDGDGIADKLIIDENGEVKCHYTDDKGNESVGDYDMVPIIDTFVKEHPDFSYHGRKGVVALTGYNGVLGYRTDDVYKTRNEEELDLDQKQFLESHPDFDFDKEVKEATAVADKMKETGWEFSSHSWGHVNMSNASLDHIKTDTEKWLTRVTPITGPTDTILFANGGDIAGTEEYDSNNEKYNYLLSKGFHIYCPVDSTLYWQQKGDKYFRMSRRNLDGYRMYHSPELLEDLFDVKEVFDKARPLPVPDMSHYG